MHVGCFCPLLKTNIVTLICITLYNVIHILSALRQPFNFTVTACFNMHRRHILSTDSIDGFVLLLE